MVFALLVARAGHLVQSLPTAGCFWPCEYPPRQHGAGAARAPNSTPISSRSFPITCVGLASHLTKFLNKFHQFRQSLVLVEHPLLASIWGPPCRAAYPLLQPTRAVRAASVGGHLTQNNYQNHPVCRR